MDSRFRGNDKSTGTVIPAKAGIHYATYLPANSQRPILLKAMNVDEIIQYWIELANADWPVVGHLFDSGDYSYALFFGHLYLEKLLKALVVKVTCKHAPKTHNLIFLAESANLDISDSIRDILIRITGYSIEARYPDDFVSMQKNYTREYCKREIKEIQEVGEWLKSKLKTKKK